MRTLIADSLPDLAPHLEAWNHLASRVPGTVPMQTYPWVSAHVEHALDPQAAWLCVFAYRGDELVGVAPFVAHREPLLGRVFTTLSTPRDEHTFGVDLLVAPGEEAEAVPALLAAVSERHPGWLYADLPRIVASSPTRALTHRAPTKVLATESFYGVGAYLPTVGDFATYRASLSGNFRSNLNKASRKLDKLPDVATLFVPGAEAGPDALDRLMQVESAGWKGEEGTAIACSDDLVAFYRSLTKRLTEAGWLEWHFLEGDGKTLAANLAVRLGRSVLVWKLGYDPAYRKCSPGTLLFERLVERAFASDDIDEIDLMTDQPWYDNWMMEKRRYVDLRLHRFTPSSLLVSYLPRRALAEVRRRPRLRRLARRIRGAFDEP